MRHRLAIAGVALALVGCGDDANDPDVRVADFKFAPATLRVTVGTTVEWRNTGDTDHTIKGPGFFSRAVAPGRTWTHRFAAAGVYRYVCTLHPDAMRGVVVVARSGES